MKENEKEIFDDCGLTEKFFFFFSFFFSLLSFLISFSRSYGEAITHQQSTIHQFVGQEELRLLYH